MVPHRQRQDEGHEHQQVVVPALPQVLSPVEREPGQQSDGEERDRVDLLVDVGLIPDGEGRGAHEDRGHGADQPEATFAGEEPEDVVYGQEPEAVGQAPHEGGEEIDAGGHRQTEGSQEDVPGPRQYDEERTPRWMGNPQDMPGSDVLARVPEGRGGSQGERVKEAHPQGDDGRPAVGRPVDVGTVPCHLLVVDDEPGGCFGIGEPHLVLRWSACSAGPKIALGEDHGARATLSRGAGSPSRPSSAATLPEPMWWSCTPKLSPALPVRVRERSRSARHGRPPPSAHPRVPVWG